LWTARMPSTQHYLHHHSYVGASLKPARPSVVIGELWATFTSRPRHVTNSPPPRRSPQATTPAAYYPADVRPEAATPYFAYPPAPAYKRCVTPASGHRR